MSAATLVPVHVEDWTIFRDDQHDWLHDLELAARAALKVPRDIRRTIRGVVADGAVEVVGSGSQEIIGVDGVGAAHAIRSTAKGGARSEGAIIRAEKVIVPAGDRGRVQESIEFYLNREAAVLVIMRLRTSKAVQLQCAVARVFVLAEQGRLASTHQAGLIITEERLAELVTANVKAALAELGEHRGSGTIGPVGSREVCRKLKSYGEDMAGAGDRAAAMSWRGSGETELRSRLGHTGCGSSWTALPAYKLPTARKLLDEMLRRSAKCAAERRQLTINVGDGRRDGSGEPH